MSNSVPERVKSDVVGALLLSVGRRPIKCYGEENVFRMILFFRKIEKSVFFEWGMKHMFIH